MASTGHLRRIRRAATVSIFIVASAFGPAAISWLQGGNTAKASHVSANALAYANCGRVFPDPQGFWPSSGQAPNQSPFAKGNAVCRSTDFLTYQEMIDGIGFLETLFPNFVEVYTLEDDFGDGSDCATSTDPQDNCSAGLPKQGATPGRQRSDIYLLRITDERVPDDNKKFFVVNLSIHGIERAGAEGGVRAAEDLSTWAWCEAKALGEQVEEPGQGTVVPCGKEGAIPHPIMETQPESRSAGSALKSSAVYFVIANPDGWRRGDPDNLARAYQRYNGNGVDLNRDWPSMGYVESRYTPWSEPESRAIGRALKTIRPRWDAGIDLHGQLIDRAFSFTMLNQDQADYGKNQRILQMVKGAWADAESRLGWSPLIIPNDAPQNCESAFLVDVCDKMYGVQWGTVWDTIGYTTTGAMGDWMNFEGIGLGADGFGNEMSFSHLSNCGTGTCYDSTIEQMHIDGNKSLIFGMIHYTLTPEDQSFKASGRVGYVFDPRKVSNPGVVRAKPNTDGLPPQEPILDVVLGPDNGYTYGFTVAGPSQGKYNGGLEGKATPANAAAISPSSITASLILERFKNDEEDPPSSGGCGEDGGDWSEVNRYYNQSSGYLQAGQAVHANDPEPGRYRICLTDDFTSTGGGAVVWDLDITFSGAPAWANPGQKPYEVNNMDFFRDLAKYMQPGQLNKVEVADVLSGREDLSTFTSIVIADDPFPGYLEPRPSGPAQDPIVHEPPSKTEDTIPCFYDPEFGGFYYDECIASYPFDVDPSKNNGSFTVRLEYTPFDSWWLRVDKKLGDGSWDQVGYSNSYSGVDEVTIEEPEAGSYRAAIVNSGAIEQPSKLQVTFAPTAMGPTMNSRWSQADLANWSGKLRTFVEKGGNLVLTDGALKNTAYMGVVPRPSVGRVKGYAGFIQFSADGESPTFDDPLATDMRQPGAAEGPGFRHQTYEPIPLGFRIPEDRDPFSGWAPNWTVDKHAWEAAGGRTVGLTGPGEVSLGELAMGQGRVRIIGPLLPKPTEEHYHPYGLTSYALTYSGYQVLLNSLQWPPLKVAGAEFLAATGYDLSWSMALGAVLLAIGALAFAKVRLGRD